MAINEKQTAALRAIPTEGNYVHIRTYAALRDAGLVTKVEGVAHRAGFVFVVRTVAGNAF